MKLFKTNVLFAALFATTATFAADSLPAPASTVGAKYVAPSINKILKRGERVDNLLTRGLDDAATVQKIGKNTYWVHKTFYNALFYVGKEGVLVFDAPQYRSKAMLQGIRSVTNKPITAIVYSHFHADHIADIQVLLDDAKKQGVTPRLIASQQTVDKMKRLNSSLPLPNEVIDWPKSSFNFEGLDVEMTGFEHAFHTDDHSAWLLKQERVLHSPDLINGDQLPFLGFAISENAYNLPDNLKIAQSLDWDWLSGGHGNVASKKDIELYEIYYNDLKAALSKASNTIDYFAYVDPSKQNNHADFTANWQKAVVKQAVETLRPKYGQYYGFDANTPANAKLVLEILDSYM